MVESVETTKTF